MAGIQRHRRQGDKKHPAARGRSKVRRLFCAIVLSLSVSHGLPNVSYALELTIDGKTFAGDIIRAAGNTIMIRLESGALISTTPNDIGEIAVDVRDLGEIRGSFVSWRDGVLTLTNDVGVIIIHSDGRAERPTGYLRPADDQYRMPALWEFLSPEPQRRNEGPKETFRHATM